MQTRRMYIIAIIMLLFSFGITQAQDTTVNGYAPDGTYTFIHVTDTEASITITPEFANEVTGSSLWIEPLDGNNFDVTVQDNDEEPHTVYHSGMLGYQPAREVTIMKDGVQSSDLKLTYQLCRHYTFDILCVNFVLNVLMDGTYAFNDALTSYEFGYVTNGGFMTYFPVEEPMFPAMVNDSVTIGTVSMQGTHLTVVLNDQSLSGVCFAVSSEVWNRQTDEIINNAEQYHPNVIMSYGFEIPGNAFYSDASNRHQMYDVNVDFIVSDCADESITVMTVSNPVDPMGWQSVIPQSNEGTDLFLREPRGENSDERSSDVLRLMSLPAMVFDTLGASKLLVHSVYTDDVNDRNKLVEEAAQIINLNITSIGEDIEIGFQADIIMAKDIFETITQSE